jgi:class 3 adenylate cyclase/tetratricopeptide (TPR) repeat protein
VSAEQRALEQAIASLQAQRPALGNVVVDAALAPLRTRLESLASWTSEQSLRQVAILFMDVVGSTGLLQRLGPERGHEVLHAVMTGCTHVIEQRMGRVLQYAGDGLLAAFGCDGTREDDTERAVLAGLELLAEGRRRAISLQDEFGDDGFDVRIGVHTGPVLLCGGLNVDGNVRGLAVHIAARMEQAAPPGAMRISHDAYRHVRGVFDVEAQAPLSVKGVDEPMLTYLVLRARPRTLRVRTRGIEGVETRMLGRDAEFHQLHEAFHRVCADRGTRTVLVVGEAGIGKSRLVDEFQNWVEARPEVFVLFRGQAQSATQGQPYSLLRDILARRFEIADSDSMATARQKFLRGAKRLVESRDAASESDANIDLLGHLLGLDFSDSAAVASAGHHSAQVRHRAFTAAAQLLCRAESPVLMLLEDLQWADQDSLAFLEFLVTVQGGNGMLLVAATRPAAFVTDERRLAVRATRVDLFPLDRLASLALVDELLKKLPSVPAVLRELLLGGASGIPFYMEELVKMLVDEGAILVGSDPWTVVPERLVTAKVPATLTGVLQARLDSLQPRERAVLQHASVIGPVFWDRALCALNDDASLVLPVLLKREFIVALDAGRPNGQREFAFKHQALHQVTYETLLKRVRREAHRRVAEWLSRLTGARANDFLDQTAAHFEKAQQPLRAAEFFARAAEHVSARHAQSAALEFVARALALVGQGSGTDVLSVRWRLLDLRERILSMQGNRQDQQSDIHQMALIADALDDDQRRGETAWRRSDFAFCTGDLPEMERAAREAMSLGNRVSNEVLMMRGQQRLAAALCMLGNVDGAMQLAREGLATSRALRLRRMESLFINAVSFIAASQDDHILGFEADKEHLAINRELNDEPAVALALSNLGCRYLNLGANERAEQCLQEGLLMSRVVGDHAREPLVLANLSLLALRRSDGPLALCMARQALSIANEVRDGRGATHAQLRLGDAELCVGALDLASAAFEAAVEWANLHDRCLAMDAAAGLARIALARQAPRDAIDILTKVIEHVLGGGSLRGTNSSHCIRLTCFEALDHTGDFRALQVLDAAHAELQAQAEAISDAVLRESFMFIPEHREILRAWGVRIGHAKEASPAVCPPHGQGER